MFRFIFQTSTSVQMHFDVALKARILNAKSEVVGFQFYTNNFKQSHDLIRWKKNSDYQS